MHTDSIWKYLELFQSFKARIACLINSYLARTDFVSENNYNKSSFQSLNSLLKNSIFSQIHSVYEDTWKFQQFQSSKNMLKKPKNVCERIHSGIILKFSIPKCSTSLLKKLTMSMKILENFIASKIVKID